MIAASAEMGRVIEPEDPEASTVVSRSGPTSNVDGSDGEPSDKASNLDAYCRCPRCGTLVDPLTTTKIKRGAITITGNPRVVRWRGRLIGLSPAQTEVFAAIATRGRASFASIDSALSAFGVNPASRPRIIFKIRQKFEAIGAVDPFERIGNQGYRFVAEADESSSNRIIIGISSSSG